MPEIVTFIGWHNSGKTTLATKVVAHLKESGYRVAVIKSTKEEGIDFDIPHTDTWKYRQAGADAVLLVAPDQQVMTTTGSDDRSLAQLAHRYFPDVDIVIGEGFKRDLQVAKIEVVRDPRQNLRKEVSGVIAVAAAPEIGVEKLRVFPLDGDRAIAAYIEEHLLREQGRESGRTVLLINGNPVPLNAFVRQSLAGTVTGYVQTLKYTGEIREIEVRIHAQEEKSKDVTDDVGEM